MWFCWFIRYADCERSISDYYNPFRYRGYYYDKDLDLYYLNARYYDSFTGRFINADGQIAGIGGMAKPQILCFDIFGHLARRNKKVTFGECQKTVYAVILLRYKYKKEKSDIR